MKLHDDISYLEQFITAIEESSLIVKVLDEISDDSRYRGNDTLRLAICRAVHQLDEDVRQLRSYFEKYQGSVITINRITEENVS